MNKKLLKQFTSIIFTLITFITIAYATQACKNKLSKATAAGGTIPQNPQQIPYEPVKQFSDEEFNMTMKKVRDLINNNEIDEFIKQIKDGTIKVNIKDNNSNNIFHYLAEINILGSLPEILQGIKDGGVNITEMINAKNKLGLTPLHKVVQFATLKTKIDLLIKQKEIDVNIKDNNGETPLSLAVNQNYNNVVEKLLKSQEIDVNTINNNGNSPLHLAVINNNEGLIKQLIAKKGTNVNIKNSKGETPLYVAIDKYKGNLNIIKILLQTGAKANIKNSEDETPLYAAINRGDYDIINILLAQSKIDVNAINQYGDSLLHCAIDREDIVITKLLIKAGTNVNAINNNGESPLHWAIDKNNFDIVEALLDARADVTAKSKQGKSALDYANGKKEEIKKLLIDHEPNKRTEAV